MRKTILNTERGVINNINYKRKNNIAMNNSSGLFINIFPINNLSNLFLNQKDDVPLHLKRYPNKK